MPSGWGVEVCFSLPPHHKARIQVWSAEHSRGSSLELRLCAPTTANPARLAPRGRQSSAGSCLHPALVLGSGLALPAGRILLPRALPGCTDPFTIQHPSPKVTLKDRSTSNKLPSTDRFPKSTHTGPSWTARSRRTPHRTQGNEGLKPTFCLQLGKTRQGKCKCFAEPESFIKKY